MAEQVRRGRGEGGTSLVIVLVMIVIFGMLVAAIAAQGQGSVMSTAGVRKERVDQYASEGAVDGAINYLRGDVTRGREGVACPSFSTASPNGTVSVACTPQPGSGQVAEKVDAPAYALLTTRGLGGGYANGTGISVTGGNNPLKVSGAVFSNSTISAQRGLDTGTAPLGAYGSCSGTMTGTPVSCNSGLHVADPGGGYGVDPVAPSTWASPVATLPSPAPAPVCDDETGVATMLPGSYLNMTVMANGIGSCDIVWMQPGSYYFDWGRGTSSSTLWTINDKKVIGGTPVGWDPSDDVDGDDVSVPGACDRAAPGVHVVFGYDARIGVTGDSELEWCPTPSSTSQNVVLYGRKSNTTSEQVSGQTYHATALVVASPSTLGDPLANVTTIDAITNSGTISGRRARGSVTLDGYPFSTIPPGSVLNSVQVRIAHAESSSTTNRVTVTAGSQTLCSNRSVAYRSSLTTDTVTCATNLTFTSATDARVAYTVTRPNSNGSTVETLDGIELLVTYTPPGLRAQVQGTTVLNMSPGGGNRGKIYVWGTVYAPLSVINIDFRNNSEAAFQRGAVLSAFSASNVPPAQLFSAFALPGVGSYTNREVELIATLNGRRQVRAVVTFDDQGATPGEAVAIDTWTAVN